MIETPSLWTSVKYLIFGLLIVAPVYLHRDKFPQRLGYLKDGRKGLIYLPVSITILFATAIVGFQLSQEITILNWGWLGKNIAAAPLADATAGTETSMLDYLLIAVATLFLVLAMLLFNYTEEELYRENWARVGIWTVFHMIMGIPLYALIPIGSVGIVYKVVYDRLGLNAAYTVHFATNSVLVVILVVGGVV